MRKKRKGGDSEGLEKVNDDESGRTYDEVKSSNRRCHYSLVDYNRMRKMGKEDVDNELVTSCKRRLEGIATAPPCGASSSLIPPGRGLKRKIGCIDGATQTGRKNRIEADYVSGATLGRGKFGSVWLCRAKASGVDFACKTLRKGKESVHREVEIMQHLSGHPGVVTLHAVYEELECFHLVMELCTGGRLIDRMVKEGRYLEQQAANIFKDVMLVIKYCHEMGVVHRDIKPENILYASSGNIKLADFGLAMRIPNGQTLSGLAGSPAYVAPEVLSGNYSEKVDIWSAGVLLHALLVGIIPFRGDSLESVFEAIKTAKLDFHSGVWETVSKPARDLVGRMLTRDVSARISADEVLRHPWILFYTERTIKTLSVKTKLKNQAGVTSSSSVKLPAAETWRNKPENGTIVASLSQHSSFDNLSDKSEEQDDCGFVDALAVAISHVNISEPKRSKLCGPTRPLEQQRSSNLMANNLCKAF